MSYKTPNVYVEEVSTLPPSVAEVSTAIPAFIGYTEKAVDEGKDLTNIPVRIKNFLEYRNLFGGPQCVHFKANIIEHKDENDKVTGTDIESISSLKELSYIMYHNMDMYFKNGGGPCYIVSVGTYQQDGSKQKSAFEAGITALAQKDEPTLIVISDAVSLGNIDYYSLCTDVLAQCSRLGERFAILDVLTSENDDITGDAADFRDKVSGDLKYGAAYYPYLKTTLSHHYEDENVELDGLGSNGSVFKYTQPGCIKATYGGNAPAPEIKILVGDAGDNVSFEIDDVTDPDAPLLTIRNIKLDTENKHTGSNILAKWMIWAETNDTKGFDITIDGDGSVQAINGAAVPLSEEITVSTLKSIRNTNTSLYNNIKTALNNRRVTLPPAAAMAGIYAKVDRDYGVWKAPANISLAAVTTPTVKISDDEQQNLNIHVDAGKSINAIRFFSGKGVIVWGARTLAGNDNEWRYISVRRLFNMIEESMQKATRFAVFEPNTESTWLKIKAMITNYLTGLWQDGALAGPIAEAAFFVNVGLGETMTAQDILAGNIIIEIGIAAVRPAEFIILKFSHKLQEF